MLILPKLIPSRKCFHKYPLNLYIINNIHCTLLYFYQMLNYYSNSTLIILYLPGCYCLFMVRQSGTAKVYTLTLIYISTPTSINTKMLISCSISKSLVLCNPKFVCKNNQYFGLSSIYFLYPLVSLPKMVNLEMPASIEQS